jgi:hypothetical protein
LLSGLSSVGFLDAAIAEDGSTESPKDFLDHAMAAIVDGKPILNVRLRYENAKIDTFKVSNSMTGRVRLGYETAPFYGFSTLLEFEANESPAESLYYDGTGANTNGRSVVADPDTIEANRFWLQFARKEWLDSSVKVGRQRVKLDDERWIGNVGWRQNEQTFDAVRAQTSLGVENLNAQYLYFWEVNRIFGDKGTGPTRDFGQNTNLVNIRYDAAKTLQATGFVYLIDANDPFAPVSSNTYGARLTGTYDFTDLLSTTYQASYAYQTDGGDNAIDYSANYAYVEAGLDLKAVGGIAGGFELLGTDNGNAVVATPFATAHKFNGFADAFLNNGGPRGLRDLFVSISPAIPIDGLKFKFIFHQFWDDKGGDNLGQEYDAVATYPLNQYITLLYKLGYYDAGQSRSPQGRVRNTLEMNFAF